jgi:prepilin-type N-terminal cleavage/methylation domain-containing protein
MNDRRHQRGFTLVEMAIAILIMGLLLAMGIPALQSMNHTLRLQGAAQNVAAQLRLARERAISTGVSQVIHFTPDYPTGTTIDYHLHNVAVGEGWSFPNDVTYFGTYPVYSAVTFSPDGRASSSGFLVLTNTRGALDTISVQLSGMVLTR